MAKITNYDPHREWIDANDHKPRTSNPVAVLVKNTVDSDGVGYALGMYHKSPVDPGSGFWFLKTSLGSYTYPNSHYVVTHWCDCLPELPKEE